MAALGEFGVVADPMIVGFGLPERPAAAIQHTVRFIPCKRLPTMHNGIERMASQRAQHGMHVVRHYAPGAKLIALFRKMLESRGHERGDFRAAQPEFAGRLIK